MEMQNANDRVKVIGINGAGFGIIQKSVMQSRELYVKAKALYAYLACFVRNGDAVLLAKSKICYDLDISRSTLKKYLCSLIKRGYLEVEQTKDEAKVYQILHFINCKSENENNLEGNKIED